MGTIKNVSLSSRVAPVGFIEPHSLPIRIWHWTFFLVLTASLVTVLFGSTLFKTKKNIATVQSQLQEKGVTVDQDQAGAVAHMYSDKLWDLHTYIGYILVGLLLSRIIIETLQPGEEKLIVKLRKAAGFVPENAIQKKEKNHSFEDVPLFKYWHGSIKQVHIFIQYLIYAYIVIHLVGVVRSDLGKHKGLVSGMIHGNN